MAHVNSPDLRRIREVLELETRALQPPDFERHRPGQWSTSQILEHLARTYAGTAYVFEKCLKDGAPRGAAPAATQRLWSFLVVTIGYLPSGVNAPEMTRPHGLAGDQALQFARESLEGLDAAATGCLQRFGPRVRVANHPILGGFTVPQWCRFHWVHTRHHLRHIRARSRAPPA